MEWLLFSALSVGMFLAIIMGCSLFSEREGFFSTFFMYSLATVIYLYLLPLEFFFRGEGGYAKHGVYIDVYSVAHFVIFQAALSLVAFAIVYAFGSGYLGRGIKAQSDNVQFRVFVPMLAACLFFYFFWKEIMASSFSYGMVAKIAYGNQLFVLTKYLLLLSCAVVSVELVKKRSHIKAAPIFILQIVVGVVTSDKNAFLIFFISVLVAYVPAAVSYLKVVVASVVVIPLLLFMLFLVVVFSQWRAGNDIAESMALAADNFSFSRVDPAGPFLSVGLVTTNDTWAGQTLSYISNLNLLVPKFLYPDRPSGVSELFAQRVIPGWVEGQGLGYSPLAEGVSNFGWFAFLHFAVLAFVWCAVWWLAALPIRSIFGRQVFLSFYKVYGFYLLFLGFRVDSLHYIKTIPLYLVGGFLFLMIFVRCKRENSMGT